VDHRAERPGDPQADGGPPQMSLSGQQDLAEITSEDFSGERLGRLLRPVLAAERARKREDLLAASERCCRRPSPGLPPGGLLARTPSA
jgi:hypothetical protein